MCLWALMCEFDFCDSHDKIALLQPVFDAWPPQHPPLSLKPGPSLTFPSVAFVPVEKKHFDEHRTLADGSLS